MTHRCIIVLVLLLSACSTWANDRFGDKAFKDHLATLGPTVPDGFTVVVQRPFVVIGDEPADTVRLRARRTVAWAARHLQDSFFDKPPKRIIDVWLFKDKASYRKHAKQLFDDEPSTPYGYFSSADNAMVMNIATGGGTLVHEMVHAYMESNFPDCPSWFNEGMGSLFEQCGSRRGQIVGLTNWRLAGLQKAIGNKSVPSFKALCSTTTFEFYHKDKGTNYAQARYLCLYLQEKGLLRRYYAEFRKNAKTDPTGFTTLKAVLDEKDMDGFKRRWEAWVLTLTFP